MRTQLTGETLGHKNYGEFVSCRNDATILSFNEVLVSILVFLQRVTSAEVCDQSSPCES